MECSNDICNNYYFKFDMGQEGTGQEGAGKEHENRRL